MKLIPAILILAACAHSPPQPRVTRDRELESLEQAVRWAGAARAAAGAYRDSVTGDRADAY